MSRSLRIFFAPWVCAIALSGVAFAAADEGSTFIAAGRVHDSDGSPVVGAMVTFRHGQPAHSVTVFSDGEGAYRTPEIAPVGPVSVRVRRIGWKDFLLEAQERAGEHALDFELERESDPAAVAAQLPANRWYALVLADLDDAGAVPDDGQFRVLSGDVHCIRRTGDERGRRRRRSAGVAFLRAGTGAAPE